MTTHWQCTSSARTRRSGFFPPHGLSTNGGAQDVAGVFGAGFDDNRGSVMAYATYRKQNPVLEASRDYSFCALQRQRRPTSRRASPGIAAVRRLRPTVAFACSRRMASPACSTVTSSGNQFVSGVPLFNFAPYNYFQRPDERYTFGTFADYEISPGAKPYLEAMFMHDHTDAQIAPSGDFFNTSYLNCDNPLLSAQQLATICVPGRRSPTALVDPTRRDFALANALHRPPQRRRRRARRRSRAYRLSHRRRHQGRPAPRPVLRRLLSVRHVTLRARPTSTTSRSRACSARSTSSPTRRPAAWPVFRPERRSAARHCPADGDPTCVPWNIFTDRQRVAGSAELPADSGLPARQRQRDDRRREHHASKAANMACRRRGRTAASASTSAPSIVRKLLNFNTDIEFQTGDLAGQGGPTLPIPRSVRRSRAVHRSPGADHQPLLHRGVHDHAAAIVTRTTRSTAATASPRIRTSSRPSSLRSAISASGPATTARSALRTSSNCSSRRAFGLSVGSDPVRGTTPVLSVAQCANTGMLATQYGTVDANPANQYNTLFGGNVNLTPEKADTYTLGVVVQPRWVPGLAFTVDYFNIKVKNLIAALPFNGVLASCAVTADPAFCNLVHRDARRIAVQHGQRLHRVANHERRRIDDEGHGFQRVLQSQVCRMGYV